MAQKPDKSFKPRQEKRLLFLLGVTALLILALFIAIS